MTEYSELLQHTPCLRKKRADLFFLKHEPISFQFAMKIGRRVFEITFDKTMQKVPTSPKICASTSLGNLK